MTAQSFRFVSGALNWVTRKPAPANAKTWQEAAIKAFEEYRPSMRTHPFKAPITGEWIKNYLMARGLEEPPHPNSWGGFIGVLILQDSLIPTGEYVKVKSKAGRSRRTPVYRLS